MKEAPPMREAPPMKSASEHSAATTDKHYGGESTFGKYFRSLVTGGATETLKKAGSKQ